MTLGQQIRRARKIALMGQSELAVKAGYSVSLIQKIEKDRSGPSIIAKGRVAKILGVAFDVEAEMDRNIEPYSERKLTVDPPLFELTIHASRWDELRPDDDEGGEVATAQQIEQGVFLASAEATTFNSAAVKRLSRRWRKIQKRKSC